MKKQLVTRAAALVILTLAALGSGYAQSNSNACNDKLIAGNYGFTVQGTKLGGAGPTGPMVGVAMTQFDGKGGLSQIDTVTIACCGHADAHTSESARSDPSRKFPVHSKHFAPFVGGGHIKYAT